MDELREIQRQLTEAITELEAFAEILRTDARLATSRAADYEEAKNQYLIALYSEEVEQGFKRTEAQRQALYRDRFKDLRRASMLAKEELQSSRDLFKGLQAKINAIQTIARMSEAEMKLLGERS
jgi:hypothetical protein